jgi:type VI secretion system secreted protein Hcp
MATASYLKVDGADGESTDEKHKNWIDVEHWAWGADNPQSTHTGGGSGQARVSVHPLAVTARMNKGSNTLFLYCCNGKHIPKVVLEQTKAGETQQVYLKITLEDAFITSFNTGGDSSGEVPLVNFSFSGAKNKVWYAPQDKSGSVSGGDEKGWDVKENKKL